MKHIPYASGGFVGGAVEADEGREPLRCRGRRMLRSEARSSEAKGKRS